MAFLRSLFDTKQIIRQSLTTESSTPKGFLAVYVGENLKKKRFFVPVYYLSKPSFQALLRKAEEEFGFDHPTGGLSLPCDEAFFFTLTSQIQYCAFDVHTLLTPCFSLLDAVRLYKRVLYKPYYAIIRYWVLSYFHEGENRNIFKHILYRFYIHNFKHYICIYYNFINNSIKFDRAKDFHTICSFFFKLRRAYRHKKKKSFFYNSLVRTNSTYLILRFVHSDQLQRCETMRVSKKGIKYYNYLITRTREKVKQLDFVISPKYRLNLNLREISKYKRRFPLKDELPDGTACWEGILAKGWVSANQQYLMDLCTDEEMGVLPKNALSTTTPHGVLAQESSEATQSSTDSFAEPMHSIAPIDQMGVIRLDEANQHLVCRPSMALTIVEPQQRRVAIFEYLCKGKGKETNLYYNKNLENG
ncbi:unnamed protein product [Brassica napus]|uniref:(rape) hypothetical protein n=1 Tax=Brassica napus TaxID=3708 RepID=A0A817AP52_BRANA|nr:unnamed protein product [Brassica napus]